MKAFKVFNPDWTCQGFQYEVGKTYSMKEEPIFCGRGFHACKKVSDCFSYYSFDPKNKVAEVILSGIIIGQDGDKQVSNKIKIIKEITWEQMLVMANTGIGNSGYGNSGNINSGHNNSGDRNSGDNNSGYGNSGDNNSGDDNSGYKNSGYKNSGDNNSGYKNSGYKNSGYKNSGDNNSGDRNSGDFNTTTPEIANFFNKPCKLKDWDNTKKPDFISNVNLNQWIIWSDMSGDEKKENKDAFVTDGYLKTISYKEAWKIAFDSASKEDIKLLKTLPNFDADIFEEITGIKLIDSIM